MAQIELNGISFSNINIGQSIVSNTGKNARSQFVTNNKIDTTKLTNIYNAVNNGTIQWSNMAFVNALEIDWNGAKPGMGEDSTNGINTTGELLSTIKNYIDNQSGYNSGIGTLDTNSKYKLVLNGTTYGPGNVDTVTTLGPSNGFWAPTSIGTAGQVLKSNGTELIWGTDNNTTYSAGTGLSLFGTTINHSNSVTAKSSGLYKIAFDTQGHITSATAVTVNDLRALLDNVYEPKSNSATLSSIAWKTTTGTSNVGTTVNTSVVTNKITCTWSDNTTTEVDETGFNVYTNSACTSAASNDWYNTAGTYYIKGTYSGKTTTNYITWTINKVNPTLTINNPASTTIADGGTTTIAVTSSVPGTLRFSSNDSTAAGSDGTAWKANITPTSTATTSFTITVTNNTAVTEQSTISTNGIKVTFTPSDTNNYNVVSDVNAIKQAITLSAKVKTNPTLTVNNPASTTIADGGNTTITVTSNVAGKLTLTTASGTGWSATSNSTSTAKTTHTITVTNLTATTTAGSIATGGIVATFTPTDTDNYNTLTNQNVLTQAITLSAKVKTNPTLTVSNPASTTIADGDDTTITVTSSVPGLLRFSSNDSTAAGSDGTAWKANITPTSTATTSFTITVTNNTAVTEQSTISTNGIKVTFTPSDTTTYNTLSDVNAIKQAITLSAGAVTNTYYQGTATETQIQTQSYINGLSYNQPTKPTSTVDVQQGYNLFIFPSSWGTPTLYEDSAHTFRWTPYTASDLGIANPSGKQVLVWEANSNRTVYIVW